MMKKERHQEAMSEEEVCQSSFEAFLAPANLLLMQIHLLWDA